MIISHSKKFMFFRVPKTGSTTAQVMLRMSSAFDLEQDILSCTEQWLLPHVNVPMVSAGNRMNPHITPDRLVEEGIVTPEQLREYDCYAFLRDTHSRFVSAYTHDKGPDTTQPSTFLKHVENGNKRSIIKGILGRPQRDYFFLGDEQVVTPLDFHTYEDSLRYLIAMAGGNHFDEIPKLNVTGLSGRHDLKTRKRWGAAAWDFEPVKDYIRTEYAADREFYQRNFGRRRAA